MKHLILITILCVSGVASASERSGEAWKYAEAGIAAAESDMEYEMDGWEACEWECFKHKTMNQCRMICEEILK